MAIKISKVGGLVKVEDAQTETSTYITTEALSIRFKADQLIISSEFLEDSVYALITDVQDGTGSPIGNAAAIAVYIDGLT